MTNRTVMAARLGPASLREARSIYVCHSEHLAPDRADRIATVLSRFVHPGDRLLTARPRTPQGVDPIVVFGAEHGLDVTPITDEPAAPDLIVIILDPLADNASALRARTLATRGDSDLVIAELPDHSD